MKIIWQDRKNSGKIDNHAINDKPQFSFQYEYLLVNDEIAEYTPRDAANYPDATITREDMELYYVNRPLTDAQKQEVIDFYNAWTPPEPVAPTPPTLNEVKERKLHEVNNAYSQAMNALVAEYPETERESWGKQEREARDWLADNTAPTPFMDAMLLVRTDTTKTQLANRIITKSDALADATGQLTGKRHVKEAEIESAYLANDQIALENITW